MYEKLHKILLRGKKQKYISEFLKNFELVVSSSSNSNFVVLNRVRTAVYNYFPYPYKPIVSSK